MRSIFFHLPSPCVSQRASAPRPRRRLGLLLGGRHVVARLDLLGVVLDGEVGVRLLVAEDPALALGDTWPRNSRGELVAPVLEGALGELHDVALVDEVTLLRLNLRAYSMAARTRRSVPSRDTA
jgi:hypothetical protein